MTAFVVLLAEIALVLAIARLAAPLARRLGQPVVVAEMVAGIVLGPSVLGRLAPHAWGWLFPPASIHVLGTVSNLGLILFVFLVGLELDVRSLGGRVRAAAGIGLASAAVPAALAVPLALYLHAREASGVARGPFVLFVVIATSITAFPVLARILVERRLLRTRIGTLAVAAAAVIDAVSACLLAFLVAMARRAHFSGAVMTTLATFAFGLGMVFVARPLLARLVARRSGDEIQQSRVGFVVVLLVFASLATELIGVGSLFGAFMLGAVIPKENGFARQLAEKLEDLVLTLLLPLFFAYSGLRTEIGALDGAGAWTACGLVIAVAFVGKLGAAVVSGRLAGLPWPQAGALGALLNTRGVVELVALNVALDLRLVSPAVFTMFILMALVTTLAAAPLLDLLHPRERALRDSLEPAPASPGFVALACAEEIADAPALLAVARACGGGKRGSVHLLYVRPHDERPSRVLAAQQPREDAAIARLESLGGDVEVRATSFASHRPARDVCDLADAKDARVLVLSDGPLVREVLESAPCTVAVLTRGSPGQERVVAAAGSGPGFAQVVEAAKQADLQPGLMVVLHPAAPSRSEVVRAASPVSESV